MSSLYHWRLYEAAFSSNELLLLRGKTHGSLLARERVVEGVLGEQKMLLTISIVTRITNQVSMARPKSTLIGFIEQTREWQERHAIIVTSMRPKCEVKMLV